MAAMFVLRRNNAVYGPDAGPVTVTPTIEDRAPATETAIPFPPIHERPVPPRYDAQQAAARVADDMALA
ncbi:MAG: hypothetical protein WA840_13925, partial [Caulobacteraceae bacterium]